MDKKYCILQKNLLRLTFRGEVACDVLPIICIFAQFFRFILKKKASIFTHAYKRVDF